MNFYITTPIYYTNDIPHIGHAYTSIACDIIARYNKLLGNNVFFLTGTDEHGQKVEKAAINSNLKPKEFVDKLSVNFINLIPFLGCEIDDFIRTTEERHKKSATNIWNILEKKGEIYLSKYSGWYSVSDEAFYSENEIEDKDNVKVNKLSGSKVEWVEEESFFFKLSKWEKKLLEYYDKNPEFIRPDSRRNEVISFVKGGLKDLSVSRKSITWVINVPSQKDHIIYVWLDALTNYLSALDYPNIDTDKYKNFWPASVHIIGKDILRFHAVYWPAFLLAANLPLPKTIYGHGWILSNEEKMSKSKGNILDPLEIIDKYGLDPLRFYLLKEVSFGNDGNISKDKLENCINSDLANNYGNLCQRVISFCEKNIGLKIPEINDFEVEDLQILDNYKNNYEDLEIHIDNQNINFYLNFIVEQLFTANKYFNDQEPWKKKNNKMRLNTIVYVSLEIIRKISILLYPIIPQTALKALNIFNIKEKEIKFSTILNNKYLSSEDSINKIEILFNKISK